MRSFAIFLGLIALGFAGIALLGYPAWLLVSPLLDNPKFSRIASRVAMLVLLVGFVFVARRLKVADRQSLGFGLPAATFAREAALALLLGVLLMLPVVATMLLFGLREIKPGTALGLAALLQLILAGVVSGLVVALIEETFLRGAMQTAITRESGATLAIVLTSIVYSATHFVAGKYRVAPVDVNYGSGVDMLATVLEGFSKPLGMLDSFLCLAAVGILLGIVRKVTGNIAACVGLHAGWVAVIYGVREISAPVPASPAAWLVGEYDGFVGWLVLAWIPIIGWALYRGYAKWGHSSFPSKRGQA
jgi:membrane protease YdiL (CAAX protease family)